MQYFTVTVTVNQHRVRFNAEHGDNVPVFCVNAYEHGRLGVTLAGELRREWGAKLGPTEHFVSFDVDDAVAEISMIYDPVQKTPCGASAWMQFEISAEDFNSMVRKFS